MGATRLLGLLLASILAASCVAAARVVPIATGGVTLDLAEGSAAVEAEGVRVVVRPSAWRGSPSYLPLYVTPFFLRLVNRSPLPVRSDYPDLRLFDEARFQYTALPPAEVGRLLQWSGADEPVRVAAAARVTVPHARRWLFWDPWWWSGPYPSLPPPPRLDDVMLQALPVGALQPGAQVQGFVYFPRLRREARELSFEFHYRLGDAPRVFTLPFAVQPAARPGASGRGLAAW